MDFNLPLINNFALSGNLKLVKGKVPHTEPTSAGSSFANICMDEYNWLLFNFFFTFDLPDTMVFVSYSMMTLVKATSRKVFLTSPRTLEVGEVARETPIL